MQELTAAQKKRLKKKGKDKAKKAGDDDDADADEPAAAATPAKGKKAAGGKKVSAAVKKMQEEMEARRAAEEEADRIEAERVLAVSMLFVCLLGLSHAADMYSMTSLVNFFYILLVSAVQSSHDRCFASEFSSRQG